MKNLYDDFKWCAELVLDRVSEDPNITHKIRLARAVITEFRNRGMTQTQAAEAIKTTQPRVSNLINGHLDRFSVEFLMLALEELGFEVGILITRK